MNRRSFLELAGSLPIHNVFARSVLHLHTQARNTTEGPVVETTTGKVRGLLESGVAAFKGIRYGLSTAGERRFMPAEGPTPWTGVVEAYEYGPRAPQPFRPMIPEIGDAFTRLSLRAGGVRHLRNDSDPVRIERNRRRALRCA
jgi:Carboxylesterase family